MDYLEASQLPTLRDAFTNMGYDKLYGALTSAGFTSVAPLMALPPEALKELPSIGDATLLYISHVLRHYGLEQRSIGEPLYNYLERVFGRVEDAPIGVLQVVVIRHGNRNWPTFAPLQIVNVLEGISDEMQLRHLMMADAGELRNLVKSTAITDVQEDIIHLKLRLNGLGFDFGVFRAADIAALQQ